MPVITVELTDRAHAFLRRKLPNRKHGLGPFLSELLVAQEVREEERERAKTLTTAHSWQESGVCVD